MFNMDSVTCTVGRTFAYREILNEQDDPQNKSASSEKILYFESPLFAQRFRDLCFKEVFVFGAARV